ncbi:MAG: hypothetical protein IKG42_04920 [Clostridia bacterium]|nr:hypothetical protein [Clostridia bacterium]
MKYVDYTYYVQEYQGNTPGEQFESLLIKASREIDNNINTELNKTKISNLSKRAQDKLKYTVCALIDLIYKKETNSNRKVTSISIDGVIKNFKTFSDEEYKKEKSEILKGLPDELICYL